MRLLRGALLAAAVMAPIALFADDRKPVGVDRDSFMAAYNGQDSEVGAAAIRKLDPDAKESYDLLRLVLDKGTWHYRSAAADTLSKMKNPIHMKDFVARLNGDKSALVRQGIAMALARTQDKGVVPELVKALGDKDWRVRREAANGLKTLPEKAAVDGLIAHWKDEKNPLVANYIRDALEHLTKNYAGLSREAWALWWAKTRETIDLANPDDEQSRKAAEAAKKAEEDGKKLVETSTVSPDVEVVHDDLGVGVPVLVIPEYGYSKSVMEPFFIDIAKIAQVRYIDLPTIDSFRGLEVHGDLPMYPLDKLVDNFEQQRKDAKVDKIAIVASGINAWIAMRYATKYPKNVLGLIFISPQSSNEKFKEATQRMENRARADNDTELLHFAMSRRYDANRRMDEHAIFHYDRSVPVPDGEGEALKRKEFSIRFADQQDSVLDQLYPNHRRELGGCLVPEFKVFGEDAVTVPVLVCLGKQSLRASEGDCQGVADHYKGSLVEFSSSGDFPFIEEPEKFTGTVINWLKKYLPPAKKK